MAVRKIPKEVEQVFAKYTPTLCRRLKKEPAIRMLMTEFSLTEDEAEVIFGVFDADKNEELSLWEFNHFCNTVGGDAHKYLSTFKDLQKLNGDSVDIDKLWDLMKTMKTADGSTLNDQQIEMYIKSTAGTDKQIDLQKFINLMTRVKLHKGSKQ